MSSPTGKRPFTEGAHASAQASDTTHASTPADLALQLRSVGSRVRKNVMEGYTTHRFASAPPSPTKPPPPQAGIFTPANDILRDVYASSSAPRAPISPRKRAREDESDQFGSGDNMHMPVGTEEDTESDGETVIILDARALRPVKPRPRRALMQTQSLPNGMFGHPRGPVSDQDMAPVSEHGPEADWSMNGSNTLDPPAFEPMVL
ncbi:hypothetical protein C8R44DRAFT_777412 [Mycena epipterygia]|nr:hypothetical protein C8R44DRAFT_777412 [Mycena epipterygia]